MEIYVIIFLYLKKERGRIMGSVKFDYSKVIGFIKQHEIDCMQSYVDQAHKMIHEKTGLGNDFLGWVNWPVEYDKEEFDRKDALLRSINAQVQSFKDSIR